MQSKLSLDLVFQFKNLKGEEFPGLSAAQLLAEYLIIKAAYLSSGKAYLIANDLYQKGKIEIDLEDLKLLEKEITHKESPINQKLLNFQETQIMNAIEEAKKKESEPEAAKGVDSKAKGKK